MAHLSGRGGSSPPPRTNVMHIPDLKFSTLLHILVVQCAISGCVSTPRDTVDEAMTSLCRGDSDGFASHLSAESRLLYLGLVELAPDRFACSGDEASPRIGAAVEKLLAAGCVDAWVTPIYMKKSRPAWMLSALCPPAAAQRAEEIIFTQTTTFGVRRRLMRRSKLQRRWETVETPYGPIRIKIGCRGAVVFCAAAEFEDCRIAGQAHHKPVREVLQAAIETWRSRTHQHKEPKTDER